MIIEIGKECHGITGAGLGKDWVARESLTERLLFAASPLWLSVDGSQILRDPLNLGLLIIHITLTYT